MNTTYKIVSRTSMAFAAFAMLLSGMAAVLFASSTAYAQSTPSDADLLQEGKTYIECRTQPSTDARDICAKGYVQGYKNPNGNVKDGCKSFGTEFDTKFAYCNTGYEGGQAAAKNAKTTTKNNDGVSDSQIRGLAKNSTACKDLSGSKQDDCVAGYIAGYKGNNSNVCNSDAIDDASTCQDGYETGKSQGIGDGGQKIKTIDEQNKAQANSTGNVNNADDCEVKFLNPFSWFICPLVDEINNMVESMDNAINNLLQVDTDKMFTCDPDKLATAGCGYLKAWSAFRIIALGIIVIAALIIIISTAFGLEILDAYTIRKTLPRVLIAIIFITLSWTVMKFMIDLSNDVGNGVRAIIYAPFQQMGDFRLDGGAKILSSILLGSSIVVFTLIGVLSFGLSALLAVLIGFGVLIIREMIITFLVIIAPIGIACMILPNTRKMWEIWQKSFVSMLVVFPIITGMIAIGRVFSITTYANGDATGISSSINQIIAYFAYILPYFILPFAFRLAGGVMSTISGLASDRSQGAFKGLQKLRANRRQDSLHRMKQGNRYRASNPLAKGFNTATMYGANIPSAGVTPWKMRSRFQAGLSTHHMTEQDEYMEKSAAFKAISGNDDYLQATMESAGGGDTEDDWRRYLRKTGKYNDRDLEQGVALIRAAKRDTNDEVFKRAAVEANFSTGTGFQEGGIAAANAAILEAAHGDMDTVARLTARGRSRAERADRWDLAAPGFGSHLGAIQEMKQKFAEIDNDSKLDTPQKKADAKAAYMQEQTTDLLEKGYYVKGGANRLVQMRGQSMKLLAPRIVSRISTAHADQARAHAVLDNAKQSGVTGKALEQIELNASNADRLLAQEYAALGNLQDQLNYASPEIAREVTDSVLSVKLDKKDPDSPTIHEFLGQIKTNTKSPLYTVYNQTRKDFDAQQQMRNQHNQEMGGGARLPDDQQK